MQSIALEIAPRQRISRAAYAVMVTVAGSLIVAGLAQIKIHLGFTPVPITGQTLGVLLVGASLGPGLGAASLLLYIGEGAVGLPFFAGGARPTARAPGTCGGSWRPPESWVGCRAAVGTGPSAARSARC